MRKTRKFYSPQDKVAILRRHLVDDVPVSDLCDQHPRARELHPGVTPRIISDNGPQFIAKDFKECIRICGMTHVRTSPS